MYKLHNNGVEYGGELAFKYLLSELTDNIYQHAEFENAFVIAQRYPKYGFSEICIIDNGITIFGSFKRKGYLFGEDYDAVAYAINGLSAKGRERGYGLGSNTRIFTAGLKGEILVVSGNGAVYASPNTQKIYKFRNIYSLGGTMVSIKIPFPAPKADIYEYLE